MTYGPPLYTILRQGYTSLYDAYFLSACLPYYLPGPAMLPVTSASVSASVNTQQKNMMPNTWYTAHLYNLPRTRHQALERGEHQGSRDQYR